jgi:hypothetical protein
MLLAPDRQRDRRMTFWLGMSDGRLVRLKRASYTLSQRAELVVDVRLDLLTD